MAQLRELPARSEIGELRFDAIFRWGLAQHGDPEIADQVHALFGHEAAVVQDDARTARPRSEQHVPQRLRPAGSGRTPDEVGRAAIEPARSLRVLRKRVGDAVHDAFGIFRRAARVDDVRVVGRRRRVARERLRAGDERMHRGPAVAFAADEQVARNVGCVVPNRIDFRGVRQLRDHRRRIAVNGTVEQVLGAQLLGTRNRDRAQAHQCGHRKQPLRRLR